VFFGICYLARSPLGPLASPRATPQLGGAAVSCQYLPRTFLPTPHPARQPFCWGSPRPPPPPPPHPASELAPESRLLLPVTGLTLRKKLRNYPGLNTPLGIPGVFFGVFPLLVYFWPFWGYFGTRDEIPQTPPFGVFRMVYSQK
jgi:hypothetical protein